MGILGSLVQAVAINAAKQIGEKAIEGAVIYSTLKDDKDSSRYAHTPTSSKELVGVKYQKVYNDFRTFGFTNIHLLPKRDLSPFFLDRIDNQKVCEVSIDGKTKFKAKQKFNSDARVVIIYHSLK